MKKNKEQDNKPKFVKEIEVTNKILVSSILGDLYHKDVSLRQILLQYGNYLMFDGVNALSGLPIITNEDSCNALEGALICKYVLENWEKVSKASIEHFKKVQNKKENKNGQIKSPTLF